MNYFETPYGMIAYQLSGVGRKTIGFMNGVMASISSWNYYVKILVALGYKVVTFDFIGQLLSDKPEGPYSFKQHIHEAKLLYDYLGIETIHLIGTSYGSEVAMMFALQYPEMVESLSIIDGTATITPHIQNQIEHWIELTYKSGYEFFWGMAPSIYHPQFIKDHHDHLETRAQRLTDADEYLRGQRILYETFLREVHFLDELPLLKVPTLIVVGEQDTIKTVNDSQRIHQKIENSELIILPNCGHVAIFEKPKELATCLLGFVHKVDGFHI